MAGINNFYNPNPYQHTTGYLANPYQYNAGYSAVPVVQAPQPAVTPVYKLEYVTGIQGANAFQMPAGVQQLILWDTDNDSFFVKKLDELGRPRVVAWKDFHDHVEPAPVEATAPSTQADMSAYVTKKDILDMLSKIDLSGFATKADLDKSLSELMVGEKGRVVRSNELNT